MFNPGDPVKSTIGVLGKVTAIFSPMWDGVGSDFEPSILVQPAGRKHTTAFYFEDELTLCRCADRSRGRDKSCVKSVPF